MMENKDSDGDLARLRNVVSGFQSRWKTHRQRQREAAQRFNVFDAISFADSELRHSQWLAFLLDPRTEHDQGSLFLKTFLAICGPSDLVRNAVDFEVAHVATEHSIPGGQLDIVIFLGDSIICIENKL
jgi:hypothetical protein